MSHSTNGRYLVLTLGMNQIHATDVRSLVFEGRAFAEFAAEGSSSCPQMLVFQTQSGHEQRKGLVDVLYRCARQTLIG